MAVISHVIEEAEKLAVEVVQSSREAIIPSSLKSKPLTVSV
jgi:hypothetical protein